MSEANETEALLRRVSAGDATAANELLCRHRARLRQMVAMRVDRRLSARFDPSDVVQEALMIAHARLVDYAREQQIPFYPWLRGLAWEQLLKFRERHMLAQKRSVEREQTTAPPINDESVALLVDRFVDAGQTPSQHVANMELSDKVRAALGTLRQRDREIIELRYLEHLDNAEIAAVLNLTVNAVRTRLFRALERLQQALQDGSVA